MASSSLTGTGGTMTQREAVKLTMSDGRWWTLPGLKWFIAANYEVFAAETSISARIREFPHERRLKTGHRGLYEYRVVQP